MEANIQSARTVSNFKKLRLLLWKNFLLQWRHKIRTLIEIGLFVLFIFPFIFISKFHDAFIFKNAKYCDPESVSYDSLR